MKNSTLFILDLAKEKSGITSDYGLSKALGISRTRISNWRTTRTHISPSDEVLLKLSELCGVPADKLSLLILSNRTNSPELKKLFERAAGSLSRVAMAGTAAFIPLYNDVMTQLCILCKIKNSLNRQAIPLNSIANSMSYRSLVN